MNALFRAWPSISLCPTCSDPPCLLTIVIPDRDFYIPHSDIWWPVCNTMNALFRAWQSISLCSTCSDPPCLHSILDRDLHIPHSDIWWLVYNTLFQAWQSISLWPTCSDLPSLLTIVISDRDLYIPHFISLCSTCSNLPCLLSYVGWWLVPWLVPWLWWEHAWVYDTNHLAGRLYGSHQACLLRSIITWGCIIQI